MSVTCTGSGSFSGRPTRSSTLAVIPEEFPGIEGLKPLGPGHVVPEILDDGVITERRVVPVDDALRRCREMARLGLFVGPSSGANAHAAVGAATDSDIDLIVTPLSDWGERYVSTGMWG